MSIKAILRFIQANGLTLTTSYNESGKVWIVKLENSNWQEVRYWHPEPKAALEGAIMQWRQRLDRIASAIDEK